MKECSSHIFNSACYISNPLILYIDGDSDIAVEYVYINSLERMCGPIKRKSSVYLRGVVS